MVVCWFDQVDNKKAIGFWQKGSTPSGIRVKISEAQRLINQGKQDRKLQITSIRRPLMEASIMIWHERRIWV
jgi:hypothetical protein